MSLSMEVNGEDTGSEDSPERAGKDKTHSQFLCLVSFHFRFIHTSMSEIKWDSIDSKLGNYTCQPG